MNKKAVVQAILDALREGFESFRDSSKRTRAAGNDAESKAEGKYDTRSIEENYLADGLARQAQASVDAAVAYEKMPIFDFDAETPVDVGALIELEFPDETAWFFLGPAGGGIEVKFENTLVTVFTPESLLGSQVSGLKVGDSTTRPRARLLSVL